MAKNGVGNGSGNAPENAPGNAVALSDPFTGSEYADIESFDDAVALVESKIGAIAEADEWLGDGFSLLETKHKDQLIGIPFLILGWKDAVGDMGPYVVVRIITRDNRKLVLTDGSTGIKDQLNFFVQRTNRKGGILVKKGLRRSDYSVDIPDPKNPGQTMASSASTYYFDTSSS